MGMFLGKEVFLGILGNFMVMNIASLKITPEIRGLIAEIP